MRLPQMVEEIELKDGVKFNLVGDIIEIEGPKGKVSRKLNSHRIKVEQKDNMIILSVKDATKKDKMMMGTMVAHIRNMIKGVTEGFVYKLAICSGHFPMNVSVSGKKFIVKNFLGEKLERSFENPYNDVNIKVNGKEVIVEGIDKERVGNIATRIEQLCRITDKDRRRFQDGIYIIEKDGKSILHE